MSEVLTVFGGPKSCRKCLKVKPADTFSPSKLNRDGRHSYCRDCQNIINRDLHRRYRLEALQHYSGKDVPFCACCGETTFEFLCLDHVDGGGTQHRKSVQKSVFFRWIRKNNYPSGFQVLCHNCNLAKGYYGMCPHRSNLKVASGE